MRDLNDGLLFQSLNNRETIRLGAVCPQGAALPPLLHIPACIKGRAGPGILDRPRVWRSIAAHTLAAGRK